MPCDLYENALVAELTALLFALRLHLCAQPLARLKAGQMDVKAAGAKFKITPKLEKGVIEIVKVRARRYACVYSGGKLRCSTP